MTKYKFYDGKELLHSSGFVRHWLVLILLFFSSVGYAEGLLPNNKDPLMFAGRSAQQAFNNNALVELLRAVNNHDAKTAKQLIDSGVKVNTIGKDGATALIWMLGLGNLEAFRILLELGANPNQYKPDGVGPPVWLSAGGGKREALQLLLEYGGDPNLVYGTNSPLMVAVNGSHLDCAELLLHYGANINYADNGLSAIDVADTFKDMLWVLNHGYTHNLQMARKIVATRNRPGGEEHLKIEALKIIDRLLEEQSK